MEHFSVVGHLIYFDCQSLLVGESGTSSAWLSSLVALSTLAEQRELGRNLRHPPPRGNRGHVEVLGSRPQFLGETSREVQSDGPGSWPRGPQGTQLMLQRGSPLGEDPA